MTPNTLLAIVALASAVGAAVWTAAQRSPVLAALERRVTAAETDIAHAYAQDTTPAERAVVDVFIRTLLPSLESAAADDAAQVEQQALGHAVTFAADHGLHLTTAELRDAVRKGIAEGPAAAAVQVAAQVAPKTA